MLKFINKRFRRLCSRIHWPTRRRSKTKIVTETLGKSNSKPRTDSKTDPITNSSATVHPNIVNFNSDKRIRLATFNASLFSMAPVFPKTTTATNTGGEESFDFDHNDFIMSPKFRAKSVNDRPKGILKQSPLHPEALTKQDKFAKSKLRVSINLPDNEISLLRNRQLSFREEGRKVRGKGPLRGSVSFSSSSSTPAREERFRNMSSSKSVVEVLRELDADILALQDVKAEEEKDMKPLSDLAAALGMHFVFSESWAPEYGNAVLSKWPIKKSKVQKIFDDSDFRNVLKATIDVPEVGEVNFHCTLLDHLDENWRMKQINAVIQANDGIPHILAGGLNSLDETDYSQERWTDIVKYYEEMGKPTPKAEVMKFLKAKHYTDAKDFAGECESVVMIAKGQSKITNLLTSIALIVDPCVQGTCKYGTRVDYIMASPNSTYKFIPGSYSVYSSKGTSDHHIVKVDVVKVLNSCNGEENVKRGQSKKLKVTSNLLFDLRVRGGW
ncbi:hypothetical protein ACFE04_015868 [Oxalis oulophora]